MPITTDQRKQVASLIAEARKRSTITLEAFGKKIFGNTKYYSKQAIYQWENGKTIPSMAILQVMQMNKEKWIRDLGSEIFKIISGESEVQPEESIVNKTK
jgi:transcriptional regulator with XRE-family HTH domain